jgi:hypothetical protein
MLGNGGQPPWRTLLCLGKMEPQSWLSGHPPAAIPPGRHERGAPPIRPLQFPAFDGL